MSVEQEIHTEDADTWHAKQREQTTEKKKVWKTQKKAVFYITWIEPLTKHGFMLSKTEFFLFFFTFYSITLEWSGQLLGQAV